jgi:hypothetical protein
LKALRLGTTIKKINSEWVMSALTSKNGQLLQDFEVRRVTASELWHASR